MRPKLSPRLRNFEGTVTASDVYVRNCEGAAAAATEEKGHDVKSVADLGDLRGKRVLIRCDLNVPLDGETITDDGRIRASLPTLNQLREAGAKIIILAHLGRPKGQVNPKYSLSPVATRLSELLGVPVTLATDVVGESAEAVVGALEDGQVAHAGERPLRARRGVQGRRRAGRAGRPVRRAGRRLRLRRLRRGAPQAGQRVRRGPAAAERRRRPGPGGGRGAEAAHRGSGPPVRRGPRRRQGVGQARA